MIRKTRLMLVEPVWRVGMPSNELGLWTHPNGKRIDCLCDVDYSGDDPEIQLPEGWHVIAGNALDTDESRTYGVHQNCAEFEPWRVKLASNSLDAEFPLDPRGEDNPILRMLNGGELSLYGSRITRTFPKVVWEPGIQVVYGWWFQFRLGYDPVQWMNFEARGLLEYNKDADVTEHNGQVREFLSIEISDSRFIAKWRHAPTLDGKDSGKQRVEIATPFAENTWYKIRMHLVALGEKYEWDAGVLIQGTDKKDIVDWKVPPELRIDSGAYLETTYCGDERGRDGGGGEWFIDAPYVLRLIEGEVGAPD